MGTSFRRRWKRRGLFSLVIVRSGVVPFVSGALILCFTGHSLVCALDSAQRQKMVIFGV